KKINMLLRKRVFKFKSYDLNKYRGKIFNLQLVNKIKKKTFTISYEKSRLIVQVYNNKSKEFILTQSPTI
ncbi:hypothetical protein DL98DRAFT_440134, partial [Cadophora sp. DSE1049]